jgi:hypothetical protein
MKKHFRGNFLRATVINRTADFQVCRLDDVVRSADLEVGNTKRKS